MHICINWRLWWPPHGVIGAPSASALTGYNGWHNLKENLSALHPFPVKPQVSTLILILSPIDSMSWRRWICNNSHSSGRHWSDFYREPFCITPSFIVNTANLISSQLPFYDASNAPWRDHQRQIFFFRSCFDSIENVCVLYFRPSRVQFTA